MDPVEQTDNFVHVHEFLQFTLNQIPDLRFRIQQATTTGEGEGEGEIFFFFFINFTELKIIKFFNG